MSKRANEKPTHIAYSVRQAGEQSYWDRVGSAWTHGDGGGLTVRLNALPVSGEITLRVPKDER